MVLLEFKVLPDLRRTRERRDALDPLDALDLRVLPVLPQTRERRDARDLQGALVLQELLEQRPIREPLERLDAPDL